MTGMHTILFVEDDTGVRSSTAALLAARGFRLLVAENAHDALRLVAEQHVDVLFTDIVMPDMDGIELARRAKRHQPDLKIMFMTAYFSRAAEAAPLGKLLFKPLRSDEIEVELEALLRAE
jgi:CheY-like chemotaxis protein